MKQRHEFWGIVLVCIGLLLLLDNLGFLAFLNITAGQLIFSMFLIGLGIWILWVSTHGEISYETQTVILPLDDTAEAHVEVEFGAGELRLQGAAAAGNLLNGTFNGVSHQLSRDGEKARVKLTTPVTILTNWHWNISRRIWAFTLSDAIPLTLNVQTGASDNRLDLSALRVTRLKLEAGASSTTVILPAHAGYTEVRGSSGAASLEVLVPEGVAARIHISNALASVAIDKNRFPRGETGYQSPDYATAANKVDIHFDIGVGSLSIH